MFPSGWRQLVKRALENGRRARQWGRARPVVEALEGRLVPSFGTVTGGTLSATEGAAFSGAVATFTTPTPGDTFTAEIDWGDGTTSAGSVTSSGGTFTVSGNHTYADEFTGLGVTVAISDTTDSTQATATASADVAEGDFGTLTPATVTPTEGVVFSGAVASFTDEGNPLQTAGDFTAAIDWGDGTTTPGAVTGPTGGPFTIGGAHTYADEGTFAVVASFSDDPPSTLTDVPITSTAVVAEADTLAAAATQPAVAPVENVSFSGPVAVFTDTGYPNNDPADFTATIDWGDGTSLDGSTTVTGDGTGNFTVAGTHTYAEDGTYTVGVALADDAPGTAAATATNTAAVQENGFGLTAGGAVNAVEGVSTGAVTVATFQDPGSPDTVADFTATIDWGDGTTDTGTITGSGGSFTVTGSHTYADEGAFRYAVTVAEPEAGFTFGPVAATATAVEGDTLTGSAGTGLVTEGQTNTLPFAFTDSYTGQVAGDFTAAIDWGDGTTDAGTVTGSGGSFTVSGTHAYADEGVFTAAATLSDDAPGTATATATLTITVAEGDTLSATATPVSATEGTPLSGTPVATFSDTNTGNVAGDFTAVIFWGDGTSSAGTVVGGGGTFTVTGDHTYFDEGVFTPTVIVADDAPGTASATTTGTATVADADVLSGTAAAFSTTEGQAFSGRVATFTNAGFPGNPATDFTAAIDWGDGTTTPGTVTGGGGGTYFVGGQHTYADEGAFTVTVTLADDAPGTAAASASATATVAEGDFGSVTPATVTPTEGVVFSGAVASFTDEGNPLQTAGDFTAAIDWGDGTTTPGAVTGPTGGPFTIGGAHTYADEGTFAVVASFSDDPPSTLTDVPITSTAVVAEADTLAPAGGPPALQATEGVAFSGAVAVFGDTGYPGNVPADFTAVIDWGDGTTDTGTVAGGGGLFTVSGTHTYAEDGTYNPVVTLADDAPGTAAATVTGMAVVAEADLTGAVSFSPTEGGFSGAVATFTDPDSTDPAAAYMAAIDWGDGTTAAGTVAGSGGSYTVSGSHSYADEGSRTVTVTFTETGITNGAATASATVTVGEGDVLSGTASDLRVVRGEAFAGRVATFTNAGFPGNPATDFTAAIDWGDGTTTPGTVTGGGGTYTVSGAHTYATAGPFALAVTLADDQPGTASAVATAAAGGAVLVVPPVIVVGAVADGSEVRVVDVNTGAAERTFVPYGPDFKGGIDVALGDVTGDGIPDVVTAAGRGGAGHIKVFDGLTGAEVDSFFAYDPTFRDGAYVAVGDTNGDGRADIITGAGFGGAPHVKVFSGKDLSLLASFFAYDPAFRNGVRVAAGDTNGDGFADVITGAGPGGGPHVKAFDAAHGLAVLESFFAYARNFVGGVYVGAGDVTGDGKADVITGAATGGSGHVKVFSGADGSELKSFFAFSPNARDGVTVAGVDPRRTGRAAIAAGLGAGSPGLVKLFDPATLSETDVFSTLDEGFQNGVYVG